MFSEGDDRDRILAKVVAAARGSIPCSLVSGGLSSAFRLPLASRSFREGKEPVRERGKYVTTCRAAAIILFAIILSGMASAFDRSCEGLSTLKLPDTTITSAQSVAAGGFTPPNPGNQPVPPIFKNLPAFCRVTAEVKPTTDSDIKLEVWMPQADFNGNFRGEGNGGFAGSINYQSMADALNHGYATASTDTGHSASAVDGSWALGHPEKITDFGYRAIHEMTIKSKAIVQAFYGQGPRHSFFAGCSNGGRQGLMEAQRFPTDYDGILSGAPANYWTKVFSAFIWDIQALQSDPESYISSKKIPAIAAAVLAACDANDGVKDGVLNEPGSCHFDPNSMACKGGDSDSCLMPKQAEALKKVYAGPHDASGKQLFPGFEPGGEVGPGGWVTWITGPDSGKDWQAVFAEGFFKNMITSSQPLDFKTVKIQDAIKLAEEQQAHTFNADNPDLAAFAKRGGKLIIYHGWSDAALPPVATIQYLESVEKTLGKKTAGNSVRLYMAPGVQHCAGGPGPDSFGQLGRAAAHDPDHDIRLALESWVEKGTAPDKIIAAKFVNAENGSPHATMTRPLCPYPEIAKYKGNGDDKDAANFVCAMAK